MRPPFPSSRPFRHALLNILLLATPVLTFAQTSPVKVTRGPYLQFATQDSMHVVWRVRRDTTPVIRYGASLDKLDQQTGDGAVKVRRLASEVAPVLGGPRALHTAPSETRQNEALISGLKPDTLYYYAVYDGDTRLTPEDKSYSFRTLPVPGTDRPLLMWVVGDSGTGNKMQSKIHTAMQEWTKKANRPLDLYLHVGDMAYGYGLDSEFQGHFFKIYDETMRNTVCWPSIGNHESYTSKSWPAAGPYYDAYMVPENGEAGGVPSGTEAFYSFDVGRAHFICLDSADVSRKPEGPMAQWLKADLDKTSADWLIAFFHHPPYTKGSHDSDDVKNEKEIVEMRQNFMPILEAGGVDLVLAGHSHVYERSMLIDGAYATPTVAKGAVLDDRDGNPAGDGSYRKSQGILPHQGTVALVVGNGGTSITRKKEPSPVMSIGILEFGSVLLDLKKDTLTGHMLNSEGVFRDTFQIVKNGQVQLTRLDNPRAPRPFEGPRTVAVTNPFSANFDDGVPMPERFTAVVPRGADWEYLAGTPPPKGWAGAITGEGGWKKGRAGFGYGDGDDVTELKDMQGRYPYVCIRRNFELTGKENLAKLGLAIAFDDGFICYINGKEVLRENVNGGSLGSARGIKSHEANRNFRFFSLADAKDILKPGTNVIALEGHNEKVTSSDFTLDPYLILESD